MTNQNQKHVHDTSDLYHPFTGEVYDLAKPDGLVKAALAAKRIKESLDEFNVAIRVHAAVLRDDAGIETKTSHIQAPDGSGVTLEMDGRKFNGADLREARKLLAGPALLKISSVTVKMAELKKLERTVLADDDPRKAVLQAVLAAELVPDPLPRVKAVRASERGEG